VELSICLIQSAPREYNQAIVGNGSSGWFRLRSRNPGQIAHSVENIFNQLFFPLRCANRSGRRVRFHRNLHWKKFLWKFKSLT